MDTLPTDGEIDCMKKNEILHNLRKLNVKGLTGNKEELANRLKSHVALEQHIPIPKFDFSADLADFEKRRDIFNSVDIKWSSEYTKNTVPNDFNHEKINSFMAVTVSIDDSEIDIRTEKPSIKGRKLYASSKVQFWDWGQKNDLILFRANIEASMRNECR